MKVLIVDDEPAIRETFKTVIKYERHEVVTAGTAAEAVQACEKEKPDIVFLDVKLPDMEGLEIVPRIKETLPLALIYIITGHSNPADAVKAIKLGVIDYLPKPVERERLKFILNHAKEEKSMQGTIQNYIDEQASMELVGHSPAIVKIKNVIGRVAASNATILITGENGTGKEVVARMIYKASNQKGKFIVVNCAALPDNLIESELFGYKKGAFTGADTDRTGKIELAHEGTLFLDEIGDMSLQTQAKLLRAIQFRKFTAVGDSKEKEVNVRFIAATNKKLEEEIKKERFREDLYYRLNEVPIQIPPLRERREDIPVLIEYLQSTSVNAGFIEFSPDAMSMLKAHDFPGNIRELKNYLKRILLISDKERLTRETLKEVIPELTAAGVTEPPEADVPATYNEYMDFVEKRFILGALEKMDWNISKTADHLRMQRSNLYKKIEKYKLKKDEVK